MTCKRVVRPFLFIYVLTDSCKKGENQMTVTNLKIERTKLGLTQWDVAQIVNCNRAYISMLETLKEEPSEEVARKLEKYFNKPINYLLKKFD